MALKGHDEDDDDKQKRVVNSFENEVNFCFKTCTNKYLKIDQIRKEMNNLNAMFTGLTKKLTTV